MTVVSGKRRGRGEDSIYWDEAKNRYVGAVSLGYSPSGLAPATVTVYSNTIAKALREELGTVKLTSLTAGAVQKALAGIAAGRSTRTVQMAHNVLARAIRHAERDHLVRRNLAVWSSRRRGSSPGGRRSR